MPGRVPVANQSPALVGYNLFETDLVLTEGLRRECAAWAEPTVSNFGRLMGAENVVENDFLGLPSQRHGHREWQQHEQTHQHQHQPRAVDFNAQDADIRGAVDPYFRGIAAGLRAAAGGAPEYRVGVYGSGAVCDYLKRARLAEYAWLSNSTAWSGYASFADWNIRQGKQSPSLSFSHDSNEARGEYGGFQVAEVYSAL